jgi:hypothetical protein
MSSSLLAEEFGLWAVVSLPSLTERVIHPEVGKVIILKVEVVEIVACGFYLLSLKDPDQLRLRFPEGDQYFGFLRLLNVSFCFPRKFMVTCVNLFELRPEKGKSNLIVHHLYYSYI